jgi:hypothetical protein
MYGGYRPVVNYQEADVRSDNHWILSLPSFTWIKAPSTQAREWHECSKLGARKMLVVGGYIKLKYPSCDRLLEIVDLSTLETVKDFADQEYLVPSIVTEVIGGK